MSDTPDTASMSLSMRLLRKGRSVENALRADHELERVASDGGILFVGQAPALRPRWAPFVGEFARGPLPTLANQSCGAVLFLQIPGRDKPTMALTFGTGHHSLDLDAFERGFGLRVTLNSVARSSLRGLDIATLDATTFLKRIQASRNADLEGFGIDVDRDLLRLAAGSPRDATFARSLAGKDALTANTKTSATDVFDKCKRALMLYQAEDYKKDFGFIDFVVPVRDRALLETLDALVFAELKGLVEGQTSDLHICLPDILDPEEGLEIGYYGLGLKSGSKSGYTELAIDDYVAELKGGEFDQISNMAALSTSHEVRVIADGEGDKRRKRKLYDCFVFEAEYQKNIYVLFGGEWFAVDKAFHASVEKGFKALVAATPFVSSTNQRSERAFIEELNANKNLLNLDQVKLAPTGMPGANLEPCDFLSRGKQFIHLKDGHSSAPISHLWNQGIVSAEAFVRDEKFRIDFRKATKERQGAYKKSGFDKLLPDGRSRPIPAEFTVVFGIMRSRHKKSAILSLPFFSKISLRGTADRIQLMGYKVEVHLIEKLQGKMTASAPKTLSSRGARSSRKGRT